MTIILIILGLSLLGFILYLASLDGQYSIDRSLIINAPVSDVYNAVVDFKTWPLWSPWLLHEPDATIIYSDDYQKEGGYYSWDGKLVGAGKLSHQKFLSYRSIDQKIEFIRPFKSVCSVGWTFKEVDGDTEVHWMMQGRMPFFFRFMTKMTIDMINKDYDLGLNLLNGFMNKENPHPEISFSGPQQLDDFHYAYQSFSGYMPEMVSAMETGFPELIEETERLGITQGLPLTVYHKVDPAKLYFKCDISVPVSQQADLDNFPVKLFLGGKYYKVESLGDYKFLELAWYKAFSHVKMLKLKLDMKRPSLEVYENNPQDIVDTNEIKTSLYLPVK